MKAATCRGCRANRVEAVEDSVDDDELAGDAGRAQAFGIRNVLVVEEIERADADPRGVENKPAARRGRRFRGITARDTIGPKGQLANSITPRLSPGPAAATLATPITEMSSDALRGEMPRASARSGTYVYGV